MDIKRLTIGLLCVLIALAATSQKREAWWRPTLAYKKDGTLDTTKTSINFITRYRELYKGMGDTAAIIVTPEIITYLLETDKRNKITKYKKGFKYVERRSGIPVQFTLLEWIPTGTDFDGILSYRWRVKGYIPLINRSFFEYTDDIWIDVDTGKAYVDPCDHKIKYYDAKDNTDSLRTERRIMIPSTP